MSKKCRVDECSNFVGPKSARGLCDKHYARWRHHGDNFEHGHIQASSGAPEAHLRAHINHTGEGCLIWPYGRDSNGYGLCRVDGVLAKASRHMCILAHGAPPFEGAEAAHSCGKGHEACFHPQHVRWATRAENLEDKRAHGTMSLGENCHLAKLTAEQALAIYHDTRPAGAIAADFNCDRYNVWSIKSGKSWRHLTGHVPHAPKLARRTPHRVLTDESVKAIYQDIRNSRIVAEEYGCSDVLVRQIRNGRARVAVTGHKRAV